LTRAVFLGDLKSRCGAEEPKMAREALALRPDMSVAVLTGAGISAESGIATFRDSGGLWERYDVSQVATPEGFRRDPDLVWRFYSERRRQALAAIPNAAHRALAEMERFLESRGRFTLVTQNVDGLHQRGGARNVLEVHGSLFRTRCSNPGCPQAATEWPDRELHLDGAPRCAECGQVLRPAVVWFGEALDPRILFQAEQAVKHCDLFLVVGTSGVVWPVAGLVHVARDQGVRSVLVNLEPPENHRYFDEMHLGKAAEILPSLLRLE